MRKRMKYGFFVCILGTAVTLVLLYYDTRNDVAQLDSHIIPSDLSSVPPSPDNVFEAVQSKETQVSAEEEHPEHLENLQTEQEPQPQSDTTAENSTEAPLKGKKVVLEDGKEIIIIENVPDSWKTEIEVHFDEEGKAHVSHRK